MTTITESHLFTAACLWEAALEALNKTAVAKGGFADRLRQYRGNHGTSQLRDDVARLAVTAFATFFPTTDCSGLTGADCTRLAAINAAIID